MKPNSTLVMQCDTAISLHNTTQKCQKGDDHLCAARAAAGDEYRELWCCDLTPLRALSLRCHQAQAVNIHTWTDAYMHGLCDWDTPLVQLVFSRVHTHMDRCKHA